MQSPTLKSVASLILPALVIPAELFLMGPLNLHLGNPGEFHASLQSVLPSLIGLTLVATTALFLFGWLLGERWRGAYVSVLFSAGVVLWLQGGLLVADYGILDGRGIDLASQRWRLAYELPIWGGLPLIALWHSRRLAPLASRGCAALLVLQFVSALAVALAGQQSLSVLLDKAELREGEPAPELWDFSKNQNVVLIILDSLQSDAVDTLLQTEREWFDRDYAGFVFFRDNAGSFPTTKASLPAIMTGAVYRNEMPLMDFIRQAEKQASIFELFHEHGYRTDLAGITNLLIGTEPSTRFDIPLPYGSATERIQSEVLQLVDLSLFRFGFHGIKAWVYADRGWRLRRLQSHPERVHHSGNSDAFLLDFAARAVATREEPVFKLIHTGGIHPPFIRGPDCEFSGVVPTNRETLIDQSRCSLRVLARLLDRMRELGIYQESLIVVSSDHGVGVSVARLPGNTRNDRRFSLLAGKALALLMVKPAGRIGPVEVSEAPSFIGDIPATIFEQLGWEHNFPGISAFTHVKGAKRKRQFASYPWSQADWKAPYLRKLVVYDIDGPVRKSSAWRLNRVIMAPDWVAGPRNRGSRD